MSLRCGRAAHRRRVAATAGRRDGFAAVGPDRRTLPTDGRGAGASGVDPVGRVTASEDRIEERCRELHDAGLVAPIYRGASMYELTTLGYLYLADELGAESLPRRRTVG